MLVRLPNDDIDDCPFCRYYADIVIAALQDIAFHTLTKVSHHMHKDLFRYIKTSAPDFESYALMHHPATNKAVRFAAAWGVSLDSFEFNQVCHYTLSVCQQSKKVICHGHIALHI